MVQVGPNETVTVRVLAFLLNYLCSASCHILLPGPTCTCIFHPLTRFMTEVAVFQ